MPRLLAIAVPTGPRFVHELTEAWANGDAVLPVDPRLPLAAVRTLLAATRPSALVDEAGDHQLLPDSVPTEDGDALVVATSGTTGEPKGVVLTHEAVVASARASSTRLAVDPSVDSWLAILPVAHVGGLSVVTRALVTDTPLVFDGAATLVSVVPTQANRLDLDAFRVVLVGGSADWRDRPANVVRTYGLTETGSGIAYDGVLLDGVDVRIGDDGQVFVRGPMLLRSYRDGVDPKDDDGWLPSGDSGWIDAADGRLHVEGRIGDIIVTGGEKVWPTVVENAIRTHPSIVDVAVAGRPDDEWGHRVVAWVVVREGAPPPTLGDVADHVRATLPPYAAPKALFTTDRIPRTTLGKVQRHLLADGR